MSVLIKGMEIPKKCGECAIYICYRTWNGDPGDEFCGMTKENVSYKTKPDWCPLSEVPERKKGKWIANGGDQEMMSYTCPKCGRTMFSISTASIPPIITYVCYACGYKSKPVFEKLYCAELPKELWPEGNKDEEDNS